MNPFQFMSKNLNFNLEFQNFIIPGIFQELSGTLEFPWKFPIFGQFQGIGYFSHSILSLELDFECRIPKFHHFWNLPGIMWNSRISLEVDYILPNLNKIGHILSCLNTIYTDLGRKKAISRGIQF